MQINGGDLIQSPLQELEWTRFAKLCAMFELLLHVYPEVVPILKTLKQFFGIFSHMQDIAQSRKRKDELSVLTPLVVFEEWPLDCRFKGGLYQPTDQSFDEFVSFCPWFSLVNVTLPGFQSSDD